MSLLVSILVLGFLIFIHELGHFLVAKWCNVGVLEFAIGFGRPVWSRRIGETRYSLRILPLGGFVRMVGDDPTAMQAESRLTTGSAEEEAPRDPIEAKLLEDRSRWFLSQSVWKKIAIVFAGPLFNLIAAVVLAVITLATYGAVVPVDKAVIGQVIPNYPAEKAGIKAGDRVLSFDGEPTESWTDLAGRVVVSGGRSFTLVIERTSKDGTTEQREVALTGILETGELAFLDESLASDGHKIGILPSYTRAEVPTLEAVELAFLHIGRLSYLTLKGIAGMIIGAISVTNIGGPIFIFGEAMRNAESGLADLFDFTVFLSVSLAVLNLLPIPVLDGGHLLFFFIEAIKGTPVSIRVIERANQLGLAILLLLTVLALGNDIMRFL